MNLLLSQPTAPLTWHILVETLEATQVAAWVAELPDCKAIAATEEAAIAALEALLNQRMATVKIRSFQLSSDPSENPWIKLCGLLQNDASFIEWSDRYWAEKQQISEEDEDLSVEESLRVM
jgi:hypothetical protein